MQSSETPLPFGANITGLADYYLGGTDSNGRKSGFGELFYNANNQTAYQGEPSRDSLFKLHFVQKSAISQRIFVGQVAMALKAIWVRVGPT